MESIRVSSKGKKAINLLSKLMVSETIKLICDCILHTGFHQLSYQLCENQKKVLHWEGVCGLWSPAWLENSWLNITPHLNSVTLTRNFSSAGHCTVNPEDPRLLSTKFSRFIKIVTLVNGWAIVGKNKNKKSNRLLRQCILNALTQKSDDYVIGQRK